MAMTVRMALALGAVDNGHCLDRLAMREPIADLCTQPGRANKVINLINQVQPAPTCPNLTNLTNP